MCFTMSHFAEGLVLDHLAASRFRNARECTHGDAPGSLNPCKTTHSDCRLSNVCGQLSSTQAELQAAAHSSVKSTNIREAHSSLSGNLCLGLVQVNAFFLKYILWIPPTNPLNTIRLTILFLAALPTAKVRQQILGAILHISAHNKPIVVQSLSSSAST